MWRVSALLLLLPVIAAAEVLCALGGDASSYNGSADQRPYPDALELARRVSGFITPLCAPRCPQIPMFRNPGAANVMLIVGPGGAKIAYNPQFFQNIYDNFGDGAIIAVLAHEFGHALDELLPERFSRAGTPELRADAWTGCALARASLNKAGLDAALTALSKYPAPSHPGWPVRLTALKLGFTQCAGNDSKLK